ncbi:MAG: hypothetical protein ACXVRS_14810 [Gaiellaceae bacterium]
MTTSRESRIDHLRTLIDLVEQIRGANREGDHRRVARLNERLAHALVESAEELLRTHELAAWCFRGDNAGECDRLAADALDELQAVVLAHGLSPSSH